MLSLLSDENLQGTIVRGLRRRVPHLDLVRVQDVGLREADDPTILQWAAAANRVVLTHDRETMPFYAFERVRQSKPMPGLFVVSDAMATGQAISELILAIECAQPDEWYNLVTYFPL